MASTAAEIQTLIDAIDTELASLITKVSYKTGEHEVKHNEKIAQLTKLREMYIKQLNALPCEEVTIWRDY